ncbi:MAG: NAD kinase [Actinomycetes bacterium]
MTRAGVPRVPHAGPGTRPERSVLVVAHRARPEALSAARVVIDQLDAAGIAVRVLAGESVADAHPKAVPVAVEGAADGCELVVVLGGDGTLLRGAEIAHDSATPLLGVNLGHVGFLAEAEPSDLASAMDRVAARSYTVEERMTLDVRVVVDGGVVMHDWALNEASVEKAARERMLEVVLGVDGRPLSRWGCDGVVCATPTGSTAYAFSAGGPVVWPEVEALLIVPLSAHALFARPLVVGPSSTVTLDVLTEMEGCGVLWCDGRRLTELPPGALVEFRRGVVPVRLARLREEPFTDRLVEKLQLPVAGWREGRGANHR